MGGSSGWALQMRFVGALALVLLSATGAAASGYSDFNDGLAALTRKDSDAVIESFSRALASSDLPSHLRFAAYYDRGVAYTLKGRMDLALADFAACITLRPDRLSGYLARADRYMSMGRYDEAIADFGAVLRLKPDRPLPHFMRGYALALAGRYADATTDFTAYSTFETKDPSAPFENGRMAWAMGDFKKAVEQFDAALDLDATLARAVVWREIAQARAGASDSQLRRQARKLDLNDWPGPIAAFFLGKVTADDLLAAAAQGEAESTAAKTCLATFFIGEQKLLTGDSQAASPFFERAVRECPGTLFERTAASLELKRLAASHPS